MDIAMAWMPGPMELVLLLVLAIFLFGPKRLPEIGQAVGKGIRSFKDAQHEEPAEDERKPTAKSEASPEPGVVRRES